MTFKIAICAGHALTTIGKQTPAKEKEWSFNDKVVRAFMTEMEKYEDVLVRRFDDPTGKVDVSLTSRVNVANAWGADIYISVHHNAFKGVWGSHTGTETFTYIGHNPNSERLASLVHPELVKAMGLRDRGVKKANYHILRETQMAAVLTEGCYMDSTIDIVKLRDDNVLKNAGIGIAKGAAKYGDLKLKPTPKPKSIPQKQGWHKENNQDVFFINGKKRLGWLLDKEKWYFFDANGHMLKSAWVEYKGKKYYMMPNGVMRIGWLLIDNEWYWFNKDGDMALDSWIEYKGKMYYLEPSGKMAANQDVPVTVGQNGAAIFK